MQVAYVRLPAPPEFWRQPKKQQQQGQAAPVKQEGDQEVNQPVVKQEPADGAAAPAAAADADSKPEQQQPPKPDSQQQQQQPGGQQQQQQGFMTSKQRRQLKRRQELAARAAERDSWAVARAACLYLVDKKLSLQGKPLAFDAAMEQVRVQARGGVFLEGGRGGLQGAGAMACCLHGEQALCSIGGDDAA